ncbi:hypothetical protein OEZ86_001089 [Tetradesmus obliquus]|nr:hypothetical protein OEZ86_001089 [Tetradesmus obliquus]
MRLWVLLLALNSSSASRSIDGTAGEQNNKADGTGQYHSRWSFKKLSGARLSGFFQDMQPVPGRATCRLGWYTAQPPRYTGNTVLCSGSSMENCLEPCLAGYDQLQNSSLCMQRCPDEAVGPAQLCPVSRTCIRAAGVCPMLSEVPYICPVPDQFLGTCAKQSYQAVVGTQQAAGRLCSGTLFKDHDGSWRCAEGLVQEPCSSSFTNTTEVMNGIGARCMQVCLPWLVDCGDTCNMPGVPCSQKAEVLCPVAPLTACDLAERSRTALRTACQHEGFRGIGGCPLTLSMHGGCGGAKLQVRSGLRHGGFVRAVEAWWGPAPVVGGAPLPDNYDGPLRAVKLMFSDKTEPVVFGNASHALSSSPRMTFNFAANELVVSSNFWSSSSIMDGPRLTPVLAGFSVFTNDRNSYSAGGTTNWDKFGAGSEKVGEALSNWEQHTALGGRELGVGLPVGAAAYVSDAGIHAFGLIYLGQALKQEL